MSEVHIFTSTGRFRSFEEMRSFVDPNYTNDGDGIPSSFMTETGLQCYEPMCIEVYHSQCVQALRELLAGSGHAKQWLSKIDANETADCAICVFPPNIVNLPERSSLKYIGAFPFA